MDEIKLQYVHYIPSELHSGFLYVSKEFDVAMHLCPCGCGNKVATPLGPVDWNLTDNNGKPSLYPSIGNWQLPCQSHYWIDNGEIQWSYQWTNEEIATGQEIEEQKRGQYYQGLYSKGKKRNFVQRFVAWLIRR